MINKNLGTKLGRCRRPYRIMEFLDEKGLRYRDIAKLAGIKSVGLVSQTIRGAQNNRKILKTLRDIGVPPTYLALPPELTMEDKF